MRKKMFPASLTPLVALVALCFLGVATSGQHSVPPKSEPAALKSDTAQGQATAPRANGDLLAEIKRSGKLRVGVSEIVPWATHDKDGNLVGFEIDVAKKLSINASRALQLDFSAPYNTTDVTLAVNIKASGSSPALQSFNKDTVTIGVLEGTTAEDMAGVALPNAIMRTYTDDSRLLDGQVVGRAAGLLVQDDGLGERSLIGTNLGRTSLGYLISDFTRTYGGKWFRSLW
jgi:ABC-type amino acid transport substrate-binding protein